MFQGSDAAPPWRSPAAERSPGLGTSGQIPETPVPLSAKLARWSVLGWDDELVGMEDGQVNQGGGTKVCDKSRKAAPAAIPRSSTTPAWDENATQASCGACSKIPTNAHLSQFAPVEIEAAWDKGPDQADGTTSTTSSARPSPRDPQSPPPTTPVLASAQLGDPGAIGERMAAARRRAAWIPGIAEYRLRGFYSAGQHRVRPAQDLPTRSASTPTPQRRSR